MERFTRRETVVLTRTSLWRLAYLDRVGIVVPQRIKTAKRARILYSWEQILELRTIHYLRQQTSLQTIRKIVAFLEASGFERSLHNKQLVIRDGEVDWVRTDLPQSPQVLKVADRQNKDIGQLKLIHLPPLADLIDDLWRTASQSQVIDFEYFKQRVQR